VASAKALASIDIASVDPRAILASIPADPSAPATARVRACRVLLRMAEAAVDTAEDDDEPRYVDAEGDRYGAPRCTHELPLAELYKAPAKL
jgi:hypothetical protein